MNSRYLIRLRNERGVALPLALFGLVAVTLLVTSALVTSSTELAISSAHQDAARNLYAADDALEQFVAQRAAMTANLGQRFQNGSYTVVVPSGQTYTVSVAELYRGPEITLADGSVERRETYALMAQPQTGSGRLVGSLIEAVRKAFSTSINVDSGLTLGVNTTVTGNATISDGSSAGAACDSAAASAAIRHSSDTSITTQGNAHIIGAIEQDTRGGAELMDYVLNGLTLQDLAQHAEIKFGSMFGEPAFAGGSSLGQNAADPKYRWGCPAKLVSGCSAEQAAYYPVVAIDAEGEAVSISGNTHAQGMIIVLNGHINITGNFKFQGIILVEGAMTVTGNPRVEGAVIAMGSEVLIDPDDSGTTTGNSLIRYNKCEIVNAQQGLTVTMESAEQTIDTPTFAWFEVVR